MSVSGSLLHLRSHLRLSRSLSARMVAEFQFEAVLEENTTYGILEGEEESYCKAGWPFAHIAWQGEYMGSHKPKLLRGSW